MFDWRTEKIEMKVLKKPIHLMEEPASPLLLHVVDAALVLLALGAPSQAADFETRARYAVVVDFESGQTLFERMRSAPFRRRR